MEDLKTRAGGSLTTVDIDPWTDPDVLGDITQESTQAKLLAESENEKFDVIVNQALTTYEIYLKPLLRSGGTMSHETTNIWEN